MHCDECGIPVWRAGEIAPAGTYVRVDDQSYKRVLLVADGPLPATFDSHVALYRIAGRACACMERAGTRPVERDVLFSDATQSSEPAQVVPAEIVHLRS